jgi:2-methylcitrate dehydratase PrpD
MVLLKNGEKFEKFVRYPKGDPENPLSWEELSAKFHSLAMRVLPGERCEKINSLVLEIETSTALREFWKLAALAAPAAAARP